MWIVWFVLISVASVWFVLRGRIGRGYTERSLSDDLAKHPPDARDYEEQFRASGGKTRNGP